MKGIVPLFLGIFGTFAFSWAGLILIPNYQIGHLDAQMDEEGSDVYPAPKSGMAERGRRIYAANGCVYCHSQQMRAEYAGSDLERTRDQDRNQKWGERRSAPRDYLFEHPVLLGKMRLGPDLANIGKSAPVENESAPPPSTTNAASAPAPQASPAAQPAPGTSPSTSPGPATAPPATSPAASAAHSPTAAAAPSVSPAASPAKVVVAANSPTPAAPNSPAAAASPANPAANAANSANAAAPANGASPPYTAAWHHRHLYDPRSSVSGDSNMPAYHFLYEKRRISGERAADALSLSGPDAVPEGWEVVPTYDAKCLVAYLMSLDQSHPLKEVKGSAATSPSAPSPAPASSPAAQAPTKEAK
jgi:cbb3-type cytochrome oxidase cytochrome c subunit